MEDKDWKYYFNKLKCGEGFHTILRRLEKFLWNGGS